MPDSADYYHEDDLLRWLDSVDGDVFFMEFQGTPKGQKRSAEEIRASMRTLERLGLARYTVKQQTGTGEEPWKAEITAAGVAVVRSHRGRIGFWYMSRMKGDSTAATTNYYTTNVGGDVTGSQLAMATGDAIQTQAHGGRQEIPSQAEAAIRGLFARCQEVAAKLDGSTYIVDEIEDAEAMAVSLLWRAPLDDDRSKTLDAVQRRLHRIAKRVQDLTGSSDLPEAARLIQELREQYIM